MAAKHAGIIGLLAASRLAAATEFAPLHDYLSRPDLKAPRLFVDSYNDSAVAPGYIFMSPFYPEIHPGTPIAPNGEATVNFHAGPMIYDNYGVSAGLPRCTCLLTDLGSRMVGVQSDRLRRTAAQSLRNNGV
jgi:hypothetical protein